MVCGFGYKMRNLRKMLQVRRFFNKKPLRQSLTEGHSMKTMVYGFYLSAARVSVACIFIPW